MSQIQILGTAMLGGRVFYFQRDAQSDDPTFSHIIVMYVCRAGRQRRTPCCDALVRRDHVDRMTVT
jgi:hypothetical protein